MYAVNSLRQTREHVNNHSVLEMSSPVTTLSANEVIGHTRTAQVAGSIFLHFFAHIMDRILPCFSNWNFALYLYSLCRYVARWGQTLKQITRAGPCVCEYLWTTLQSRMCLCVLPFTSCVSLFSESNIGCLEFSMAHPLFRIFDLHLVPTQMQDYFQIHTVLLGGRHAISNHILHARKTSWQVASPQQ